MAKKDLDSEILGNLKFGKLDQDFLVVGTGNSDSNISIELGKSGTSFAYTVSGAQSDFSYVNGNYSLRSDISNDYGYGATYANAPTGTFPVTVLTSREGTWYFFRVNSASENVGQTPPIFATSSQTGSPVGGSSLWSGFSNLPQSSFRVDTDIQAAQAATLRYNAETQQIEFAPHNGEFAKLQSAKLGEVISVELVDLIRGFSIVHNLGNAYVQHFSIWPPPASIQFNVNSIIVGPNPDATSKIPGGFGFVSFDGSAQSQLKPGTTVLEELTVSGDTSTYYNVNGTYLRSSDQIGQNWTRNTGGGFAFGYLKIGSMTDNYCSLHQYSNVGGTTRYHDISGRESVIDQPQTAILVTNKYNRDSDTREHITPIPAEAIITNGSQSSTTLQITTGSPWPKIKVSGFGNDYDGVYSLAPNELFGGPDNFTQYSNGTRYIYFWVNKIQLHGVGQPPGQFCRWLFCDKNPYNNNDYVVAAYSEHTIQWPGVAAEMKFFSDLTESTELQLVIEEQQSKTIQLSGSAIDAMNGFYDPVDEEATGDARVWSNGAYQVKKDASGRWSLDAASLSLYDVSGAANPWSGVYAMEDSEGNLIDCTIEIQYQTFTSKKLALPTTALPNKVQVTDGSSTSIFTIVSAQSSAHPTNGDSWTSQASGSSLRYSNFRWEYSASGNSIYSDWTLQWPDAASFNSIEIKPYESDAVTMSGLTSSQGTWQSANGNYNLLDSTKTGTERIWKHESQEFYIRNVSSQWVLTNSATSTSYDIYVQDYDGNNYQAPWDEESGDSYIWFYQGNQLSDVEFCPDIAGNSNFLFKAKTTSSDHGAVYPYDGVYVRQLSIPGTTTPVFYEDAADASFQIWIRHSPYELLNKNVKSAIWKENGSWNVGQITLNDSGAIASKEIAWSAPVSSHWPWEVFNSFTVSPISFKIKKTKLAETPEIPQGIKVVATPGSTTLVGEYSFRKIYKNHLFPQENDAFWEFNGTGKSLKVSKDYYGNLIWNLAGSDGYSSYQGDAEWFWPDKAKIAGSHGGGAAEIQAITTGNSNLRMLPANATETTSFTEWGVYRRLESYIESGITIQFNYNDPRIPADSAAVNGILKSGIKVWIKASEWESFNSSNSGAPVEVPAFVLGSVVGINDGKNGIYIDPAGLNNAGSVGSYGYVASTLYFGKVYKKAGSQYLGLKIECTATGGPQCFWPWELKAYYGNDNSFTPAKTDLQQDSPAPPVALQVSGFHERSNGYYANRVINNEYAPTNGDRWRICGLDDSQFRQVDSVWYNSSNLRWEMYCWTGDSHQYAYSSTTTEKWPDDEGLLWYWGDRGYMSSNSAVENAAIERRTDTPISRRMVVKGLVFQNVSPTYYYGQIAYSLRNSFEYSGRTPDLEDRFAIIGTYDYHYRGTLEICSDSSGYYWKLGTYVNNEYDSQLTKNVYTRPVSTLSQMKWPWEIAEWACTHPGGWGGVQSAPLAFGVSDDSSITQAVGSYNSQIATGNAGYSGANSVWTCTTRDINVENLGTPTYYDRFISADGRAVVFLNADVSNIDNGCRWVMRFPLYDESGTTEDQYQRYYAAYRSASMDQRSPKWPWEVAWETPNTSYWPNPAPSFIKGNGANGGLYWGDRVFVKAKNSTDSYELPFLGGKQLPNLLYGQYAYASTYDGQNDSISPVFNGEFYLAPELLTWENFEGYDVAYRSKKDDKLGYYQPPNGGSSIAFGENGAFGAILGKYNKTSSNWTWTFVYFSRTGGGINSMPKYQYTGNVPIGGEVWECVDWVTIGVPQDVHVFKVDSAKPQAAAAPNLVPKASDFWEGTVDGNTWSISWNSTTKHYEAAVLGASFESNVIAVDESGNPKLFPWELTEEQWGAEFTANVEIGIEGSRFEVVGSDITGGYNEDYKRNTPANGLYFSRKFGGKFANSALAGENYDTYYIRRQTGTNSTDFREQGALKFITEHEGGPQWRLATNPNSDRYVFALVQRGDDWRSPYADYASLKPPYDFENAFYSWYGNGYFGKIVPWPGYVIANGQRDYKTIPMFGARFNTKFKVDGVEETIAFTYSDDFEPLGDAPTAKSRWYGSKTTSTAPIHFSWFWDSDSKCWILRITHEDDTTDITSVSGDSAEPSLFPWEYKAYEFSNWSPGAVAGYMISGFEWQGSRIVVNGISQYSGNGGHDVNGSYVSFHADPENYTYDSTNKNWCWFNKFGCRFGRWNDSTGWALNSRDATFFNVYATNSSKLPWKDEDFSSDSSYSYGPSNFLVNGRAQDNPTGFTSAVDVIKCDADLKGRYVLVGYRTITADGGFEELVYRKADNGCKLVWDGSKWTLYGPDLTDWYTASSSDQLRYPQDQALTWEVGIVGEGSAANLPLIVAVPGEAKLPRPDKTVLTVAGAGIADVNGTYNPVDGVDAFGSSMIWLKSDGTYKIWCNKISGVVANWLLGEANSITGKYLLRDLPTADGAISGPYNEDGSSKTWEVDAGNTAPAPTVAATIAKDVITVSGCSSPADINGEYELVDSSAEGDDRIWKHTSANYWVARGTSYRTWMVSGTSERPYDPGSSSVYFYGSDASKANPYNDDGTSYSWNAIRGSGNLQIVK